jgi:hypothetical protein
MKRFHQAVLIISLIVGSWLGMQAVHELGHVLGAWLTSGRVERVVLYPLTISRTDMDYNPHPLIVVWAGPVCGAIAPLILWAAARAVKMPGAYVPRFFAGFCLIANGAYIGVGSFDGIGDCGTMLQNGSQPWQLWLFGLATAPVGLWLWHGQGPHFGLGASPGKVNGRVAWATFGACAALVALGFWIDGE